MVVRRLAFLIASWVSVAVAEDGGGITKRVRIDFDPLPTGWIEDGIVMDSIWSPLGLVGTNHYAFGGPDRAHAFSSRSDPSSANYQAWFGAYVVSGNILRGIKGPEAIRRRAIDLAEFDQKAWLEGMGDKTPLAKARASRRAETMLIDGARRTVYEQDMESHSDLSAGETPIAKRLGMPDEADRKGLTPFHEVILHTAIAPWYDSKRDVTVLVYWASASYQDAKGNPVDYGPKLNRKLNAWMRRARLVDVTQSLGVRENTR